MSKDDQLNTVRAVRDVGFPIVISLILVYQMGYVVPQAFERFRAGMTADVDRIVKRLEAMEASQARQIDSMVQLVLKREQK